MAEFKLDTVKKDLEAMWNVSQKVDSFYPVLNAEVNAMKGHFSNQLVISFNGGFGATNSIDFPSQHKFIRNLFIEFDMTVATADATIAGNYLAHNMLKVVEWNIGSTDRIRRLRENIVMEQLLQCESEEKRDKMLALSGRGGALSVANHKFYACLPVPWNSMNSQHKAKPFPVYLLQKENLRLDITLSNASEVFSSNSANVTLNSVKVYFEVGKLKSQENYLMPSSGNPVTYPFLLPYDQVFTLSANQTEVDLTGLRSAEVSDILLQITADGIFNNGKQIKNIKLTLSGQEIWNARNDGQEMWDLLYDNLPHTHVKNIITINNSADNVPVQGALQTGKGYVIGYAGAVVNFNAGELVRQGFNNHYYYVIPIGDIIQKAQHNKILGADFNKETLKLEITRVGGSANDKACVSYRYQSAYAFTADGSVNQVY